MVKNLCMKTRASANVCPLHKDDWWWAKWCQSPTRPCILAQKKGVFLKIYSMVHMKSNFTVYTINIFCIVLIYIEFSERLLSYKSKEYCTLFFGKFNEIFFPQYLRGNPNYDIWYLRYQNHYLSVCLSAYLSAYHLRSFIYFVFMCTLKWT